MTGESIFLRTNHLFLRAPDGGVEDVANMGANGFGAIFCNIGDYPLERWDIVRSRARSAGVVCGPWLRTAVGGTGEFDPERLGFLLDVADEWQSPLIVNAESELKGTGSDATSFIAEECGDRDWALSMEPNPFANVDWRPIKVPVLPQCFGPTWADAKDMRSRWQAYGVRCVVATFGTYSGWQPDLYDLLSPYGLYTADDCGNQFSRWAPRGTCVPCTDAPPPTNGGGEVPTKIGDQHGITASMNRLRSLDPGGTALVREAGAEWPPLSTLDSTPLSKWKAYDKLERTLSILRADHDAATTFEAEDEAA